MKPPPAPASCLIEQQPAHAALTSAPWALNATVERTQAELGALAVAMIVLVATHICTGDAGLGWLARS